MAWLAGRFIAGIRKHVCIAALCLQSPAHLQVLLPQLPAWIQLHGRFRSLFDPVCKPRARAAISETSALLSSQPSWTLHEFVHARGSLSFTSTKPTRACRPEEASLQ